MNSTFGFQITVHRGLAINGHIIFEMSTTININVATQMRIVGYIQRIQSSLTIHIQVAVQLFITTNRNVAVKVGFAIHIQFFGLSLTLNLQVTVNTGIATHMGIANNIDIFIELGIFLNFEFTVNSCIFQRSIIINFQRSIDNRLVQRGRTIHIQIHVHLNIFFESNFGIKFSRFRTRYIQFAFNGNILIEQSIFRSSKTFDIGIAHDSKVTIDKFITANSTVTTHRFITSNSSITSFQRACGFNRTASHFTRNIQRTRYGLITIYSQILFGRSRTDGSSTGIQRLQIGRTIYSKVATNRFITSYSRSSRFYITTKFRRRTSSLAGHGQSTTNSFVACNRSTACFHVTSRFNGTASNLTGSSKSSNIHVLASQSSYNLVSILIGIL